MKKILLALVILLVAAIGGFWYGSMQKGTVGSSSNPKYSATEASKAASLTNYQDCTNTKDRFTIKYPQSWFTSTTGETACTFFNPTSLPNPPQGALITVTPGQTADQLSKLSQSSQTSNEEQLLLNKRDMVVNNWTITRIETAATGGGKSPKGTVSITYLVPNGDNSLIVLYSEKAPLSDRESIVVTLEQMLITLSFK